ncbi:MAG: hypothetical protein LBL23_00635 [Coriobacteriales bacterium]|jgi:peptidoglycan hydrolase CwlO-like protein|nr:hypothetical protein [Coriobacteriales bacterium]
MRLFSKSCSVALALCLAFSLLSAPAVWADEAADGDTPEVVDANTPLPDIAGLQKEVDLASAVYDEATQRILLLEKEIRDLDARLSALRLELPNARELSNASAREYYRTLSTSNLFLEMVLGATSLADFFAKIEYTARVNQSYLDAITSLTRINAELEEIRALLDTNKTSVEEERLRAEEALLDARAARDSAEETARRIAEATAAATAAAAEAAEAEQHTPEAPVAPSNPGTPVDPGTPETPSDKQAFVNLWTPRIDAYLAGSPLDGYGYAFANAAYDYNVDPRWSPAISCLESSKGRYCFLPCNAWGWGSVTWPDWETAIYAHVRGLSRGYGYTISEASAQKYCPPNWEYWYSFVSNQMTLI